MPSKPSLPSHIEDTVKSIAKLHAEHYERSTFSERLMARITVLLSLPGFLAVLTVIVIAWVGGNLLSFRLYHVALDYPPFPWLEDGLTVMALYMAALILTTQRRADQLADLREQMTLELAILTEKKAAKLIELMEEFRRDSPEVRDRIDHEAREMSAHADPRAMVGAIEQSSQDLKDGSLLKKDR